MNNNNGAVNSVGSVATIIVTIYALYLAYKCNNGFTFGGFCMAFYYSWCYIAYKLITTGGKMCGN